VSTFIELEVGLAVSPRSVVGHRDAPRIGVEGEAVLFISEGDRAPDDVIDRNVIATQFETVAVAGRGRAAGREHPVAVRYAILNGNGTDGPCIGFREEVPAVVNVVVSDATAEDIAGPGRQLAGEPIGVLAVVRVEVIVGSAIEDQIVGGPFALRSARRMATELKP